MSCEAMEDCRPIEEKLSAYLDGELPQQDRQRVEVHVDRCDRCRKTLSELERIHTALGADPWPEPSDAQWSRMMSVPILKTSRGLGWLFGIGGTIVLAGYAAYEFATDETTDALIKVAVAGLLGGMGLLLLSVLIERLRAKRTAPYEDVDL
ncbi:MAG: anti-sigma factor family protein [Phycisphaerae bacterium]